MKKRILFICLGNICRSPAAEAVAASMIQARGLAWEVDSAGTIAAHAGEWPDPRMRAAGERRGYQFVTKARQVTRQDLQPGVFDLVIAMDRENFQNLSRLAPQADHIRLFGQFVDEQNSPNVPDPYYGGAEGFEEVLDMLETGCPRLLDSLAR